MSTKASVGAIALAFAVVYLVWGSTYLAIRFAIETLPPFLMAGIRFTIAGLIVLGGSLIARQRLPSRRQIMNASIVGVLMLAGGNGAVTFSEKSLPSGLAALLVATASLWLIVLNWLFGTKKAPTVSQSAGLILGLIGLALLVLPSGQSALGNGADLLGAVIVVMGAMSWAGGTLFARACELPESPWVTNGTEMLAGGVALLIVALMSGETGHVGAVSARSTLSLAYLILFGSILAYTAYMWLNRVTTPARLGTYAYVNPVVAILLGALFAGEPITLRAILAMALILTGVVLLSIVNKSPKPALKADLVQSCGKESSPRRTFPTPPSRGKTLGG